VTTRRKDPPLAPEVLADLTRRAIKRMGGPIDAGIPGEYVVPLVPDGPAPPRGEPYDWSLEADTA
jgi:hypothetical protein